MKNVLIPDLPTVLALKLEKGRVLGGGNQTPPALEQKLTYFSNHEGDIQSLTLGKCHFYQEGRPLEIFQVL